MEIVLCKEEVTEIILEHMRNLGYSVIGTTITRCERNSLIHVKVQVNSLERMQKPEFSTKER